MRYNPFRPNGMVAPGMFAGRDEELKAIEQSLFQTKNENPHHFLNQGERGIGKSSLFVYVDIVASGELAAEDGSKLRFITISVDLNGCASQLDIVRAIGRELRRTMSTREWLKARAKKVWDWVTNWEVLGVAFHGARPDMLEDARDSLVDRIVDLCDGVKDEIDGILILIDEADSPGPEAELGSFVKLFTERLSRRRCNKVLIGMAGLPSIIARLKESHESSARIFEVYSLQPLEPTEREWVVQRGLTVANEKNEKPTQITTAALKMICELSEGYPHFLQQFAFSAFAEDSDYVVDVEDVARGAFNENGALAQLGVKYFSEMYHARINSEDYRRVLDTMADHGDEWVAKATLIKETPKVTEHNVGNALAALKEKKIILQEEGKRGLYRLPTKSFAAWINAVKASREKPPDLIKSLFESE